MCGCRVGALKMGAEEVLPDLCLNQVEEIGSLRIVPRWQAGSGLHLLVLVPLCQAETRVRKSGRAQAGAFLVRPGEGFSVCSRDGESSYTFEAAPAVELPVERGTPCAFCRTPLEGLGLSFTGQNPEFRLGSGLLCRACALALESPQETSGADQERSSR